MRCNGVIFDLDGTLADTVEDIGKSVNAMLEGLGHPTHDAASYREYIGRGARHLVWSALPESERDRIDEPLRLFREIYAENLLEETAAYEEVPEMLEAIQDAGIQICVLSNKPHDMTQRIVEALFRRVEFTAVVGQRQGIPRKPDPTSALELAARMKVAPGRCALVGDTEFDMQAGRNARMLPIAALWGFHDEERLREAGAAMVAPHPEDVIRILID